MASISREQVEELKLRWLEDPSWEIEDAEGFEEFKEELSLYSENIHLINIVESQNKEIVKLKKEVFDLKDLKVLFNGISKLLRSALN